MIQGRLGDETVRESGKVFYVDEVGLEGGL